MDEPEAIVAARVEEVAQTMMTTEMRHVHT
jgi:hypothetical protein